MLQTEKLRIYVVGFVACFMLFAGALSAQTLTTDLFEEVVDSDTELEPVDPSIVIRQRLVSVRFSLFFEGNEYVDVLNLNPFDDVRLVAIRERVERGTSGGFAWFGRIEGIEGSQVTLVVGGQKLSGTIELPDVLYQVRSVEGSLHIVREVNPFAFSSNPSIPSASPGLLLEEFTDSPRVLAAGFVVSQEEEVVNLVNQERAILGINPLSSDDRLTAAARAHSEDMLENNYFSHTGLDGRSPGQRIEDAGYFWNTWGENIAFGYSTPEAVLNAWMNSPGHRANILNTTFCDIGVGYASVENFWTQDFAREQGVSVCLAGDPGDIEDPTNPTNPTNPTDPGDVGRLKNGGREAFSLAKNKTVEFTIEIPGNVRRLLVRTTGSGNADLYVKRASINWPSDQGKHNQAEFKAPNKTTSNEQVRFVSPTVGVWHALIHGDTAASGSIISTWR